MPYPKPIVDWLLAEKTVCFLCKQPFLKNDYRELHSTTGDHYVLAEAEDGRYIYICTDPAEKHPEMRGQIMEVETNEFGLGMKYEADAVVVHRKPCHDEVKLMALALSREKNSDFCGNVPTPRRLHEVSHYFLLYKKKYASYLNSKRR